jgi:ubiquinone/menaquinone biosynthesis C-methylase UbiE
MAQQHVCPWWFAYSFDNPLRRLLHPPEKVLSAWVRPGMTVLDVGCGIGHFTLGMARMVGPGGRVIAADLQERALAIVERRARRAGVADRIATHRCGDDACGVAGPVDFALAFWMLHETPSAEAFCREMAGTLAPGGRFLVAEPAFHVEAHEFEAELAAAARAGLRLLERPRIRFSRAALFGR